MKIGIYTVDFPAKLGGGYVLRDDVSRAALARQDRHSFELVFWPVTGSRTDRLLGRPGHTARKHFRSEVSRRGFDLLWFNHIDPVYIDAPYIFNVFDLQHRVQPWFPEVSAQGQWQAREQALAEGCRRAALVTVGSEETKQQVCFFYGVPADNVKVLPFPTPQRAIDAAGGKGAALSTADVRKKYGIKNDFLFYPAQFWAHKNHVNLLHALKLLKDRGRNLSLVLTGADHGNRGHVEAVCGALGLSDRVHFCGFVPYEDILAFYLQARGLSYLSLQGPENLPPLEAMALGCPVILSDIRGARPIFGDAPIWVNPLDPQSIALGIASILDNPAMTANHIQAGKDLATRNDCEKYLETFEAILDGFLPYRICWR